MAFDLGFDFRGTAGYVTDPAYGVPVLGEQYPHTYTNGNGQSVNGGWSSTDVSFGNRASGNDPKIAGINYNNSITDTFKVDLSSGSAPGAGNYTIDLAIGDAAGAGTNKFRVLDTSTVLIDGSAGYATIAGHFIDATLTNVAATTTWTGTTVSKTFATTLAKLEIGTGAGFTYTLAAHFRLTLQDSGTQTNKPISAVAVGVVALAHVFEAFRILSATTSGIAALTKIVEYFKVFGVTSINVVALLVAVTYARGLAAISTVLSVLSKTASYFRTISLTTTASVLITTTSSRFRSFAIESLGLSVLFAEKTQSTSIDIAAIIIPDLGVRFIAGGGIMAAIFQAGKVPVRTVGQWAIGVVRCFITDPVVAGVVPVHTVTDEVAGVVPIFLENAWSIGVVPIYEA